MELHDGDIIVFKNYPEKPVIGTDITININFKSNNTDYNSIRLTTTVMVYNSYLAYDFNKSLWNFQTFKTIIIVGDQTITDETFINWLYENTVSGLPSRVMENMYAVVGDQIQYSFSNIGNVVGSIVNNGVLTIFTLGIFIVSLAVGLLRRISRRKNFK